jgi:hypothetical protein
VSRAGVHPELLAELLERQRTGRQGQQLQDLADPLGALIPLNVSTA